MLKELYFLKEIDSSMLQPKDKVDYLVYFYEHQLGEASILDEVTNIIAKDKIIVRGESTLWGDQNVVLFSKSVHVWTSTMVILQHIFPIFLHNMVDYNTKSLITKKYFFPTYIVQFQNMFVANKCTSLCTKKMQIYFLNDWNDFYFLWNL